MRNNDKVKIGGVILRDTDESVPGLVRYYMCGQFDETGKLLHGIVYDYAGGGVYQDWFAVNGEMVADDGEMEYDEMQSGIETITHKGFIDECQEKIYEYAYFDTEHLDTKLKDEFRGDPGTIITFGGDVFIPVNYSMTIWDTDSPILKEES